jgi:hypothetical protein
MSRKLARRFGCWKTPGDRVSEVEGFDRLRFTSVAGWLRFSSQVGLTAGEVEVAKSAKSEGFLVPFGWLRDPFCLG